MDASTDEQGMQAAKRLERKLWRRLAWLALLFVVYGSLVPLNYQPLPWQVAVERFWALLAAPPPGGSRVDVASNVLLSMPLAFAAGQSLLPGLSVAQRWWGRAGLVLGIGLLAVLVEFTQQFFPPRTLSLTDIQAQTAGAVLALLLQWRWGGPVSVWMLGWWQRERTGLRVERALKAYWLLLLGFALLPLDLTVNPVEIYQKWSQGRVLWLPFSGLKGGWDERLYEVLTDVVIWVPVGAMLAMGRRRTLGQVLGLGVLAALLIEGLQVFVFSRVTDSTDVLLASFGVALGAVGVQRWRRAESMRLERVSPAFWGVLGWGWVCVVVTVFWFPFAFEWPMGGGGWGWLRVPFATYQAVDEFRATNEALRRLGFFLPGGLLWGLHALARQRGQAGLKIGLGVAAVAVLVEAGQVFQPGKVADLTDAGLSLLGVWIGWRLAAWLRAPAAPASDAPAPLLSPGHVASRPARQAGVLSGWWVWLVIPMAMVLLVPLPGVPYNLRELVAVGPFGLASALGLSGCLYGLVVAPLWFNHWPAIRVLGLPLVAALTGALAYGLLRLSVPLESIHDIVGAPVWRWPWEWERLWRFMGLWSAAFLAFALAGLFLASVLCTGRLVALIHGVLVCAVLLVPLYGLIVQRAATDNLTELLAGQASLAAFSWVGTALCGLALAGSALAAWAAQPARWRLLLPCVLVGAALAPWGLLNGLEVAVVKYGQVFSALQFLLSAQRNAYVDGGALWVRLALALGGMVMMVAVLQYPAWRRFVRERQSG